MLFRSNRTTVGRLQRMNGMSSTRLSIGQRLIVSQTVKPVQVKEEVASSGELKNTYYRIRRGDTLGALARRYGTTVSQLKQMNNMNSSRLSIGKNIVVKQERVEPEPETETDDSKSELELAKARKKYPKVYTSPMLKSENILKEYIDKVNEENGKNPYDVTIM